MSESLILPRESKNTFPVIPVVSPTAVIGVGNRASCSPILYLAIDPFWIEIIISLASEVGLAWSIEADTGGDELASVGSFPADRLEISGLEASPFPESETFIRSSLIEFMIGSVAARVGAGSGKFSIVESLAI